jgi:cyclic GMP-AMP synthase DncV-like protein
MFNMDKRLRAFYADEVAIDATVRKQLRDTRVANEVRLENGLVRAGRKKPKRHQIQGGYAMKTVVQQPEGKYDIDNGAVFSPEALHKGDGDMTPLEVRAMVCSALQDPKFKRQPEVRKHCVRVYYDDGHWVDVPAYRELTDPYTKETYLELASTSWTRSDPAGVTKWFRDHEAAVSPDAEKSGDPQFRRITAYVKGLPKRRTSWTRWPTGFMVSVLVEECYKSSDRDDVALRNTLVAIRNRLLVSTVIYHPVLRSERLDRGVGTDEDSRCVAMREKLEDLLPKLNVLDRSDCTGADAAKAWDSLYGTTYFNDSLKENTAKAFGALGGATLGRFERGDGGRYGDGGGRAG